MATIHFKLKHVLVLTVLLFALAYAPAAVDAKSKHTKHTATPTTSTPTPTTPTPTPTTATPVTESSAASEVASTASSAATEPTASVASEAETSAVAATTSSSASGSAATAATSTSSASTATTTTTSNGTCTFSEPTTYITTEKLDWLWTNRLASYVPDDKIWIFDQLIAGKGNVNYCVRWNSKDTLAKATAAKVGTMLQRQLNEWNAWLMDYGCWPYENVTVAVVGWATNDTSLFGWTDDSLGVIYSSDEDADSIPMCPTVCYKHRDGLNTNSDLASCEGAGFDLYLQLDEGMGLAGYGYDWGEEVDETMTLEDIDDQTLHIVAHEMGHGFGLPDFYETSDEPPSGWPDCIMKAGSSMVINDADGWMLRWVWEKIYTRYY